MVNYIYYNLAYLLKIFPVTIILNPVVAWTIYSNLIELSADLLGVVKRTKVSPALSTVSPCGKISFPLF